MKNLHLDRLDQKFREVDKGWNQKELAGIRSYLVEAQDTELTSINPQTLARKKGLNRMRTLKSFLHLTKAGVFDLQWSVRCPHCTGRNQNADNLKNLKRDDHCPLCTQDFQAHFDQNVELSFKVNPGVVELVNLDPFETIMAAFEREPGISLLLDQGEDHHLVYDMEAGNYLLINKEFQKITNFAVGQEKPEKNQKHAGIFTQDSPFLEVVQLKPGRVDLTITNRLGRTTEFLFVRLRTPEWTNASVISTLQEFRDLFSEQMLNPKETFSIRNMTILFTDIKGSTAMYENLGDSKAFYLVKEHFAIMEEVIQKTNGAIVKTIGDAVMAVFSLPEDGASAAFQMIQAFDEFNKANHLDNQIIIKIGVHTGPCIAVTLNDRIDYFGTAVNIAARVQGLSDGRDIMVSERFYRECGESALLQEDGWEGVSFSTSLKGLKDEYTIYKLSRE